MADQHALASETKRNETLEINEGLEGCIIIIHGGGLLFMASFFFFTLSTLYHFTVLSFFSSPFLFLTFSESLMEFFFYINVSWGWWAWLIH